MDLHTICALSSTEDRLRRPSSAAAAAVVLVLVLVLVLIDLEAAFDRTLRRIEDGS